MYNKRKAGTKSLPKSFTTYYSPEPSTDLIISSNSSLLNMPFSSSFSTKTWTNLECSFKRFKALSYAFFMILSISALTLLFPPDSVQFRHFYRKRSGRRKPEKETGWQQQVSL